MLNYKHAADRLIKKGSGDSLKISCVIPTKNRCHMTLEAIESVMRQQFFRVEIIVVDDGSTDATLAEVNTLFPDIITMRLHGVGPGRARNAGVAIYSCSSILMISGWATMCSSS